MNVSPLAEQKLFGLFELDPSGMVLYSRLEPDADSAHLPPDISGRNFYEEVAPFENVEEFRRHIMRFTHGDSPADNFNFECRYEDCTLPVRVLLARMRERTSHERTKSVLVHIRRGD